MQTGNRIDDSGKQLILRLRREVEERIKRQHLTGNEAIRARAKVELTLAAELKRTEGV